MRETCRQGMQHSLRPAIVSGATTENARNLLTGSFIDTFSYEITTKQRQGYTDA